MASNEHGTKLTVEYAFQILKEYGDALRDFYDTRPGAMERAPRLDRARNRVIYAMLTGCADHSATPTTEAKA